MFQHPVADERRRAKLERELGDRLLYLLNDNTVTDIARNSDGRMWVKRFGEAYQPIEAMNDTQAFSLISTVATLLNDEANVRNPIIEGELPIRQCRFEGLLPPLVASPTFSIRRPSPIIRPLDEYIGSGILDRGQARLLEHAITTRQNIVVVGATGSGKTTFAATLLEAMAKLTPNDRIVLLEDTIEISLTNRHCVSIRTDKRHDLGDLIRVVLRLDPERIIVGEVRDSAALHLLKLWWSGHRGGLVTLHAEGNPTTPEARVKPLYRLEQMIGGQAQVANPQQFIAEAVDLLVAIAPIDRPPYRRITAISQVGWAEGGFLVTPYLA